MQKEVSVTAWVSVGVALVAILAGTRYFTDLLPPLTASVIFWTLLAIAVLVFFNAVRQHYISVGKRMERDLRPHESVPAGASPPPAPSENLRALIAIPQIRFVVCESVPIIRGRSRYSHLPAEGDLRYALVAAFRQTEGPGTLMTAHLRIRSGEAPLVTVHSAAWVGSPHGAVSIGTSQTQELILAVNSNFHQHADYYAVDITTSGPTQKSLRPGKAIIELELDVVGTLSQYFTFEAILSNRREEMTVTLSEESPASGSGGPTAARN